MTQRRMAMIRIAQGEWELAKRLLDHSFYEIKQGGGALEVACWHACNVEVLHAFEDSEEENELCKRRLKYGCRENGYGFS